jgi:hypothetical protein
MIILAMNSCFGCVRRHINELVGRVCRIAFLSHSGWLKILMNSKVTWILFAFKAWCVLGGSLPGLAPRGVDAGVGAAPPLADVRVVFAWHLWIVEHRAYPTPEVCFN